MKRISLKLVSNITFTVILLTFVGRLFGFIREQVIASQFGTSNVADLFVTAITLPQFVSNILGGVITVSFIPLFVEHMNKDGENKAEKFASGMYMIILYIVIIYSVISLVLSPLIVNMMFPTGSREEAVYIFCLMIPVTVGMTLTLFFSAYANARNHFIMPSIAPILMSISFIVILIVLPTGLNSLVWASLFSTVISYIYVHISSKSKGFRWGFKIGLKKADVKSVVSIAGPMAFGSLFIQSFTVTDKIIARSLPEGSISALSYAFKLTQLPLGIFATAISTLIFPSLSILAARGDIQGLRSKISQGIRLVMIITFPAIIALIVYAKPLTKLLFERGNFDSSATILTSNGVILYAIGIIGASLTMVISRLFYAKKEIWTPVISNIVTTIINVSLSIILVKQMGYLGLAASYSLSVTFNFLVLLIIYIRDYQIRFNLHGFISYFKLIITAGVSYIVTELFFLYTSDSIVSLIIGLIVMVIVYLTTFFIAGVEEAKYIRQRFTNLLGRRKQVVSIKGES